MAIHRHDEGSRNAWEHGVFAQFHLVPGHIIISELGFSWPSSRFSRPWKGPQEIGKDNFIRLVHDVVQEMEDVVEKTQEFAQRGLVHAYGYPIDLKAAFLRRTPTISFSLQELLRAITNGEYQRQTDLCNTSEDLSRRARLAARFFDDSICSYLGSTPGLVFGVLTGLLNHSCAPNAMLEVSDCKGSGSANVKLTIRAVREIPAGEEITILYSDGFEGSTTGHRLYLKEILGFDCCCAFCSMTSKDPTWRSLRSLCHEMVVEFTMREMKPPQLYRLAGLIFDSFSLIGWYHPILAHILDICCGTALKEVDFFRAKYFQGVRMTLCTYFWSSDSRLTIDARRKLGEIACPEANVVMDSIKWEPFDETSERVWEMVCMMHRTDQEYFYLRIEHGKVHEFPEKEARLRQQKFRSHETDEGAQLLMTLDGTPPNSKDQQSSARELSISPSPPQESKSTKKKKKKNAVAKAQKVPQRIFGDAEEVLLNHDDSGDEDDQVDQGSTLENEQANPLLATPDQKDGAAGFASQDEHTHGQRQPLTEDLDVFPPKSAPVQLKDSEPTSHPLQSSATDRERDRRNEANAKSTSRAPKKAVKFGKGSADDRADPENGVGQVSNIKGDAEDGFHVQKPKIKRSPWARNNGNERNGSSPDKTGRRSMTRYQQHKAEGGTTSKTQMPVDRAPKSVGNGQFQKTSTASDASVSSPATLTQVQPTGFGRESVPSDHTSSALDRAAPDNNSIESPRTRVPLEDDISDSMQPVIRVKFPTERGPSNDLACDSRDSSSQSVPDGDLTRSSQESKDLAIARAYFRPYLCPFGDPEGMSKQVWLSSQTSKTHFRILRRDIAHLIAAKDGTGSKDSGFVLSSRRDSMTGRVEGRKMFMEQRLRRHSFNNDGGSGDRLKEAETW
ncbi:hypothetical protein PV10_03071 [Exophiala mesophila]|uniref:SET domain-containing protein n=1 Tax=Exophiala mesophila TaxID=212818 RepID=A0A0D1Y405_EXOME|nr:uncharacterized protein PV10_03071 [Exophiala mesophila]KIV95411.1 hypothetical protein PV10_03071 [Exophiala mesophila]